MKKARMNANTLAARTTDLRAVKLIAKQKFACERTVLLVVSHVRASVVFHTLERKGSLFFFLMSSISFRIFTQANSVLLLMLHLELF